MSKIHILNRIRRYRAERELSQKDIAYLLGLKTTSQISRYERGKSLPDTRNFIKIGIICRRPSEFLYPELMRKLREVIFKREEKLKKQKET